MMVYLDNAATTPLKPEVLVEMMPFLTEEYANASSIYGLSKTSKDAIDLAKNRIADYLHCNPDEIYFTSGGTESNNWALMNAFKAGSHIITSKIEHPSILNTCKYLETLGCEVTYLDVNKNGCVHLVDVENAIKPNTALISIMFANNEIGTIQNIKGISSIASKYKIPFHTDAVQAFGHEYIDVNDLGIDMLSASAHKLGGPKGIGLLYVRKSINLSPFIHGGEQQDGMRAGTLNTAGIVGFGKAADISSHDYFFNINDTFGYRKKYFNIYRCKDYLKEKIINQIENTSVNGDSYDLANNLNICFGPGIKGESLVQLLSNDGIYVSTGSACASESGEPSHVLTAIGLSKEEAESSIRFSLPEDITFDQIDYVVDRLKIAVARLRLFA